MPSGNNRVAYLFCTVALAAALTAGGCASSTSGGEKLASSYSRTRGHLAASQDQVDQTLATLNGMRITHSTNLSNAFKQYKTAADGLEEKGKQARQLAADMQENVDLNMMNWQKEMESVQDSTVRTTLESRRNAVRSNYEQAKTYAQDARKAYETFLTDNQDIVKALSINLSPAAVSELSAKMDRTAAAGQALKQKIAAMQQAMDNMAKGQPSVGSAPAAPSAAAP
jgi:hypothetical protein